MKLLDIERTLEDRLINQEFTFEFEHGESYTKYEAEFTINSVITEVFNGEVRIGAVARGCFMNIHDTEVEVELEVAQGLSMELLELEIEELDGEVQ